MRDLLPTHEGFVIASMPELSTAQTMFLQFTLNNEFAASAFTAGTDRSSAGEAIRFNEIWKM